MKYRALLLFPILFFILSCNSDKSSSPSAPDDGHSYFLTLISPNGGESIPEGSSFKIKWTGNITSAISINYSTNNGAEWRLLAESVSNSGIYDWSPVPAYPADKCRIKIASNEGGVSDQSDNTFKIIESIAQVITLQTPGGGELIEAGSGFEITWNCTGIDSVRIELSTDNGLTWNNLGVERNRQCRFVWNPVSSSISDKCKIRVSDAKDGEPKAESTAPFSIVPHPYLKVVSPAAGEKWYAGSNELIKWESAGVINVKISYSINGGASWNVIAETTPSTGEYLWQNIPLHNSAICRIRIEDASDGSPLAESAGFFTLAKPVSTIQITQPNGREEYIAGEQLTIKWNSQNVNRVNISLNHSSYDIWESIAMGLINTGSFIWTIPDVNSSQCLIKVEDASDLSVMDVTDARFSVKPPKSIKVIYPNGNETFQFGDSIVVSWVFTGVKFINVQYSLPDIEGNRNWITIYENIPSSHSVKILLNALSQFYKIRIEEYGNPSVFDESDFCFSVIKLN